MVSCSYSIGLSLNKWYNTLFISETSNAIICYPYILKQKAMTTPINPEDNVPLDDAVNSESEDQQSQKDIHSNGFDENFDLPEGNEQPNTQILKQAFDAAESAYTLNVDRGIAPKKGQEEKDKKK
jgi:hypothetical protein